MGRRKKEYTKQSYESTGISWDTSANIYISMLQSKAWAELTAKQQVLYLYCKAQRYAEKKKPSGDLSFTMNRSKWCDLYGLYTVANNRMFYRDMAALIGRGFIICLECGAITRTKSVYAFSDMWQNYGTDRFVIPPDHMTKYMLNEVKKQKEKGA
ncbi:hypothetical protein LJC63_01540 [Ruminococcaceae bacterium OttesenSCG-928-L11]|nr:hypothetical protein [Ruminococcaceae bacterium OttesenSCG-928-L11]